ncbi:hypothetical protein H4K35_14740 [Myroides sp. NP-2]|uniref:hypothetical protein n=1 Tax=Myroides sp. NP-2 TaxID=2759945 RepID=UPI0015FD55DB|nr:hypothetical protein [Myroides sp. NP-2]MBB1151341.1 hypothetical protein [Myroides sp. NP-2]
MRKALFYSALSIAAVIYMFQQTGQALPSWVNNYVNDFLTLPLVLGICLFVARKIKGDKQLQLPLPLILTITAFYCFYFEWYLPQHNDRYTGDVVDCLLYFAGATVFYLLHSVDHKK